MQARGVSQPTTSSDMVIGPVHVVPAALSDYSVFSNTERPLAFMASIPSGGILPLRHILTPAKFTGGAGFVRAGCEAREQCAARVDARVRVRTFYMELAPLGSGSGGAPSMADTVTRWPPMRRV